MLLVSFELDEILSLADRILVIYEGRIVLERTPDTTDEHELGLAMTGGAVERDRMTTATRARLTLRSATRS